MAILKNGFTGALMMVVEEDRVQEYLERGHTEYAPAAEPAATPAKPARKRPAARSSARKKAGE